MRKRILLIFLIISCTILTSCTKNEEPGYSDEYEFVHLDFQEEFTLNMSHNENRIYYEIAVNEKIEKLNIKEEVEYGEGENTFNYSYDLNDFYEYKGMNIYNIYINVNIETSLTFNKLILTINDKNEEIIDYNIKLKNIENDYNQKTNIITEKELILLGEFPGCSSSVMQSEISHFYEIEIMRDIKFFNIDIISNYLEINKVYINQVEYNNTKKEMFIGDVLKIEFDLEDKCDSIKYEDRGLIKIDYEYEEENYTYIATTTIFGLSNSVQETFITKEIDKVR